MFCGQGYVGSITEDGIKETFIGVLDNKEHEIITRYYTRKKPLSVIERKLRDTRDYAVDNFPYEPGDEIYLKNRKITRFASQLDYILLKLMTTEPRQLFSDIKKFNVI